MPLKRYISRVWYSDDEFDRNISDILDDSSDLHTYKKDAIYDVLSEIDDLDDNESMYVEIYEVTMGIKVVATHGDKPTGKLPEGWVHDNLVIEEEGEGDGKN